MKLWMKRISVFMITLMTLGMYTPPIDLNANTDNKEVITTKAHASEIPAPVLDGEQTNVTEPALENEDSNTEDDIYSEIIEQAQAHTISKLGPRITDKIAPDFTAVILPNIETVLHMLLTEAGEEGINYYGISEFPAKGYGERIFNVHDYRSGTDVARFDVRRENRPGEGYWFQFHYHLRHDGYEEHYPIGEVFWAKDTPPKWMA